ncbi:MAG: hypothetical protein JO021_17490 [Alphaproteobacteria bacterium]|nr:hypothetical protein [Alphaproteobacteria bacterium]
MAAKRTADGTSDDGAAAAVPAPAAADPADIVPKVRRAVHDLRQPVQAMRLFVHLLSTRLQRDEDRALVVKLDEALENIEGALRNLMSTVPSTPRTPPADDAAPTG